MKSSILALILSFMSVSINMADDACCQSQTTTIQERIREIDVNIALKKYEQLATEKAKAQVDLALLETQGGENDDRRDKSPFCITASKP